MGVINKFSLAAFLLLVSGAGASALQFDTGKFSFKLSGYGTGGMIQPKLQTPVFIGDWRVRGQMNFSPNDEHKFGAVYALDAAALDDGRAMREAFGFYELRDAGRIELGFTDSIARKLGVGLPDVGGLRINDRPIFHKKIVPAGPVISDTTLTTVNNNSLVIRASIATPFLSMALSSNEDGNTINAPVFLPDIYSTADTIASSAAVSLDCTTPALNTRRHP